MIENQYCRGTFWSFEAPPFKDKEVCRKTGANDGRPVEDNVPHSIPRISATGTLFPAEIMLLIYSALDILRSVILPSDIVWLRLQ